MLLIANIRWVLIDQSDLIAPPSIYNSERNPVSFAPI
jgi:hypothetical protein